MAFYQVRVEFTVEDEKTGKVKKQKVNYLTDAVSVTDAEATTVKYLTERGEKEFEVKAVSESSISEIITPAE